MDSNAYYLGYLKRTQHFPQSLYHRPKHRMVRELFCRLARGSKVLDAGCGIGNVTSVYCGDYGIFGIDEQQSAVQHCKKHHHGEYAQQSLYDIRFPDETFDLILFLDTIEHLDRPLEALKELNRVLKRGSKILVCTMNYASPSWFILGHTWHSLLGGSCKPYSRKVHPTRYTAEILCDHCNTVFREVSSQKTLMGMELFYIGSKR